MNDTVQPRRSHGGLVLGLLLGVVVLGGLLAAAVLAGVLWLGVSTHDAGDHAVHPDSVPVEAR